MVTAGRTSPRHTIRRTIGTAAAPFSRRGPASWLPPGRATLGLITPGRRGGPALGRMPGAQVSGRRRSLAFQPSLAVTAGPRAGLP
jgi:hypothetical protein